MIHPCKYAPFIVLSALVAFPAVSQSSFGNPTWSGSGGAFPLALSGLTMPANNNTAIASSFSGGVSWPFPVVIFDLPPPITIDVDDIIHGTNQLLAGSYPTNQGRVIDIQTTGLDTLEYIEDFSQGPAEYDPDNYQYVRAYVENLDETQPHGVYGIQTPETFNIVSATYHGQGWARGSGYGLTDLTFTGDSVAQVRLSGGATSVNLRLENPDTVSVTRTPEAGSSTLRLISINGLTVNGTHFTNRSSQHIFLSYYDYDSNGDLLYASNGNPSSRTGRIILNIAKAGGYFYGPDAEEVGGSFSIKGSGGTLWGGFVGKK